MQLKIVSTYTYDLHFSICENEFGMSVCTLQWNVYCAFCSHDSVVKLNSELKWLSFRNAFLFSLLASSVIFPAKLLCLVHAVVWLISLGSTIFCWVAIRESLKKSVHWAREASDRFSRWQKKNHFRSWWLNYFFQARNRLDNCEYAVKKITFDIRDGKLCYKVPSFCLFLYFFLSVCF